MMIVEETMKYTDDVEFRREELIAVAEKRMESRLQELAQKMSAECGYPVKELYDWLYNSNASGCTEADVPNLVAEWKEYARVE
jgi:hypothetical protein